MFPFSFFEMKKGPPSRYRPRTVPLVIARACRPAGHFLVVKFPLKIKGLLTHPLKSLIIAP
jgi:hypothetical protein